MPRPQHGHRANGRGTTRRALLRAGGAAALAGFAGCLGDVTEEPSTGGFDPEPVDDVTTYPDDPAVTMFQRGIRRLGYYGDEVIPGDVTVDWERAVNRDPHTAAKATPMPTPDGPVLIPADTGALHAVTPEGEELWTRDFGIESKGFHATPAIAHGTAYIGGYEGNFYAVDVATGDVEWEADLGDAIGSSAAYVDGTLYVGIEYVNPPGGGLWAVDAETGDVLWFDDRVESHPHSSPGISPDDGRIVMGNNDHRAYAWEYPSGEFAWQFEARGIGVADEHGDVKGPVATFDGKAYFGSWDHRAYCVDLEDGSKVWEHRAGHHIMTAPAIDPREGVVYFGSHDDHVYAFDHETGDVLWRTDVNERVIGAVTVTAGTVLAGSYDGHLYALNKETGERRWRVDNEGRVTSGAIPKDGRIYYATRAVVPGYRDGATEVETPGHARCLVADD